MRDYYWICGVFDAIKRRMRSLWVVVLCGCVVSCAFYGLKERPSAGNGSPAGAGEGATAGVDAEASAGDMASGGQSPATAGGTNSAGASPGMAGGADAGGAPWVVGEAGNSSGGNPTGVPYPFYPDLDLTQIPFHVGAGAWGERHEIAVPELPRTLDALDVATPEALALALSQRQRAIRITASWSEEFVFAGSTADIDLIIPKGVTLGTLFLGFCAHPASIRRLRIRGETPGEHSGGLLGQVNICGSDGISDVVIDGVDMRGSLNFAHPAERVAVVNLRAHVPEQWFLGTANDIVFAGINVISSALPPGAVADAGWGIELSAGAIVVFDSRLQGTRFHRLQVRSRPDMPTLAWVNRNTFVDPHQARIFVASHGFYPWDEQLGQAPPYEEFYGGVWAQDNAIFADADRGGCAASPEFSHGRANFARITHNRLRGMLFPRSALEEEADGDAIDTTTGNDYGFSEAAPPWAGPGDPRSIPLLPVNPEECTPISTCECWTLVPGCPCSSG